MISLTLLLLLACLLIYPAAAQQTISIDDRNATLIQILPLGAWRRAVTNVGNFSFSNDPDAVIQFRFPEPATGFIWVGHKRSGAARFSVCVDCGGQGESSEEVDGHDSRNTGDQPSVVLYARAGLSNGVHNVTIRNLPDARFSNQFGQITLDRVIFFTEQGPISTPTVSDTLPSSSSTSRGDSSNPRVARHPGTGPLIGAIIGSIGAVTILITFLFLCIRRRGWKRQRDILPIVNYRYHAPKEQQETIVSNLSSTTVIAGHSASLQQSSAINPPASTTSYPSLLSRSTSPLSSQAPVLPQIRITSPSLFSPSSSSSYSHKSPPPNPGFKQHYETTYDSPPQSSALHSSPSIYSPGSSSRPDNVSSSSHQGLYTLDDSPFSPLSPVAQPVSPPQRNLLAKMKYGALPPIPPRQGVKLSPVMEAATPTDPNPSQITLLELQLAAPTLYPSPDRPVPSDLPQTPNDHSPVTPAASLPSEPVPSDTSDHPLWATFDQPPPRLALDVPLTPHGPLPVPAAQPVPSASFSQVSWAPTPNPSSSVYPSPVVTPLVAKSKLVVSSPPPLPVTEQPYTFPPTPLPRSTELPAASVEESEQTVHSSEPTSSTDSVPRLDNPLVRLQSRGPRAPRKTSTGSLYGPRKQSSVGSPRSPQLEPTSPELMRTFSAESVSSLSDNCQPITPPIMTTLPLNIRTKNSTRSTPPTQPLMLSPAPSLRIRTHIPRPSYPPPDKPPPPLPTGQEAWHHPS